MESRAEKRVVERPGLRDRKKQRTRETIEEVAFALFCDRGFRDTTIREIAEGADVSPRTVSAYFPAKEDLVFRLHEEFFSDLRERFGRRAAGETAADTLRDWLLSILVDAVPDIDRSRQTRALIDGDATLRTYERGLQERAEEMVAKAVALDLGLPEDDLLPHMVGAATIATLDAIGRTAKERRSADFEAEAVQLVDDAMAFIGAGVQGLASRRP